MNRVLTSKVVFGASCVLGATLVTVASDAAVPRAGNPDQIPRIDGTLNVGVTKVDITDTTTTGGTTSDATLTFAPNVGTTQLLSWVGETLAGRGSVKTVPVLELDFNHTDVSVETFNNVSIAEVGFPALDATSSTPAYWTVKLTNAVTSKVAGSHTSQSAPPTTTLKTQSNNYKVDIAGLDMKWTMKVAPIVVRTAMIPAPAPAKLAEAPLSPLRPRVASEVAPTAPVLGKSTAPTSTATISDFVLTFNTGAGAAAYVQIQQWVSSGGASKAGTIQYLAPNLTTVLCVASFASLSATKITANSTTHRADVELKASGLRLSCPGI